MKKLILIVSLLFSLNGWAEIASSDIIQGTMKCKVKSQSIIEIEEGIPKQYPYYVDKIKTGEELILEYELFDTFMFRIILKDQVRDDLKFYRSYEPKTLTRRVNNSEYVILDDSTDDSTEGRIIISNDSIDADYADYSEALTMFNSRLALKRYYKGDWNGIFTHSINASVKTMTLDCKPGIDQYDELMEALEDYAEENAK